MKVELYSGKHHKTIELNDINYYAALGFISENKSPVPLLVFYGTKDNPTSEQCGSLYTYCGELQIVLNPNYENIFNNFETYNQLFPMWDITWGLYLPITTIDL